MDSQKVSEEEGAGPSSPGGGWAGPGPSAGRVVVGGGGWWARGAGRARRPGGRGRGGRGRRIFLRGWREAAPFGLRGPRPVTQAGLCPALGPGPGLLR